MNMPSEDSHLVEQAEHWVVRLASGDIDANELEAFKAWLAAAPEHRRTFERERALWQSLEGRRAAFASSAPQRGRQDRRRWTHIVTAKRAIAAAAAAIAIMLIAPGALIRLQADQIADTGEIRIIALPDGSTVMLDSKAAIAINFDEAERRIELLRGRAWFDVRHGDNRPFRVAARDGVTQDIGTAFEVDNEGDAVTVGVTQGAVRVTAPQSAKGLALRTLDRVRYTDGGPVERLASGTDRNIAPWRRGLILIDGLSVREAVDEVARYRPGTTIMLADTSQQPKVSGVFRVDTPDEALETLAQMAGLRVTRIAGNIALLRH